MTQGFSSDVVDQSFLFDQSALPLNPGFMPSPPYTPYSNQTTTNPSASPPYSNFSPSYSKGTPSPQSSCGYQNAYEDNFSTAATPISDHMIPNSASSQTHMPLNQYVNQQATPITTPMSKGMFTNGITSNIGPPQAMPGQSLEVRTTFIPNGNATSNLTGYSESNSLPMESGLTDMFGLSGPEFTQRPMQSLTHAPPHVRQSVIHSARQRYSGATPTSGRPPPGSSVALGHVTEYIQAAPSSTDADSSISQWSQWLKGSAPAPVC